LPKVKFNVLEHESAKSKTVTVDRIGIVTRYWIGIVTKTKTRTKKFRKDAR
jgi:hypothetical protein